jgi:hypothetical protein
MSANLRTTAVCFPLNVKNKHQFIVAVNIFGSKAIIQSQIPLSFVTTNHGTSLSMDCKYEP